MEELSLWVLITMTLACCAAAMRISYNAALQQRSGAASGYDTVVGGRRLELRLAMGLFLVLPFLLLTCIVPSATARAILNFTFCWVTPCKLLLLFHTNFFLDNPSAWTLSHFSHFLLAFLLPVRIKGHYNIKAGLKLSYLSDHLSSLIIRLSILLFHLSFHDTMAPPLTHVSHCVALYLILDLPHRIASIGLLVAFGIETHPTFHSPWLSSSPTDFWGRRWDLTANALLRHTVYNPIVNIFTLPSPQVANKGTKADNTAITEIDIKLLRLPLAAATAPCKTSSMSCVYGIVGTESNDKIKKSLQGKMEASFTYPWSSTKMMCAPMKPPSLAARLVGVNTTFFVSGLVHELLYFCVTQGEVPTWEVTAFFMVQGMATSMEILMRRAGRSRRSANNIMCLKMPRPLKVVLTMAFMYATATWLFFPQLARAGVYTKCAQEHKAITQAIRTLIIP